MSDTDEQNTEQTTEETNEATEETTEETKDGEESSEETEENSKESEEESEEETGEELDLDRAKAKIAKANDEAKNLRTRLREAEEKLKNAKTPEEVEAITKQMTEDRVTAERNLLIENVALKHKLPEELAELLKGETREELEAHAKKLQKFAPDDEDDEDLSLEGGLSPRGRDSDEENDPRALARKFGRGSKRR